MGNANDQSLFIYHKGTYVAFLLLYVDDIVLTAPSDHLREQIISLLRSEFAMTGLGFYHIF